MQRHHRLWAAPLPGDERHEQRDPRDQWHGHPAVPPAIAGLLDQREHWTGESERAQHRANRVDVMGGAAIRGQPAQQLDCQHHRHQVDREDPSPRGRLHERAAPEWTDDRRHPGPCRPAADRAGPLLLIERVHDQRKRARDQQRAGRALHRASADQPAVGRSDRAQQREGAEPRQPEGEHALAAEHVAKRATHQQ